MQQTKNLFKINPTWEQWAQQHTTVQVELANTTVDRLCLEHCSYCIFSSLSSSLLSSLLLLLSLPSRSFHAFRYLSVCMYIPYSHQAIQHTIHTQYFPSGRLPLAFIYPIAIFYICTCMQYKIYVFMRRRINIDNMHQKTVQPIHTFQLSSRSKQIMCFLLFSRLKKTL